MSINFSTEQKNLGGAYSSRLGLGDGDYACFGCLTCRVISNKAYHIENSGKCSFCTDYLYNMLDVMKMAQPHADELVEKQIFTKAVRDVSVADLEIAIRIKKRKSVNS